MRKILPYKPYLIPIAKKLRKNMTLGEILLWQEIKGKQLGYRFSRQIPIDNFIVDFFCRELQLAIEIDGSSHHHDTQPQKDFERQKRLESLGVRFLRFDDADVKNNISWVLNEIVYWLNENGPTPSPSREGSP